MFPCSQSAFWLELREKGGRKRGKHSKVKGINSLSATALLHDAFDIVPSAIAARGTLDNVTSDLPSSAAHLHRHIQISIVIFLEGFFSFKILLSAGEKGTFHPALPVLRPR